MCGIFCYLSRHEQHKTAESMKALLTRRGPDSLKELNFNVNGIYLTVTSSVLSMRGADVVSQPLVDDVTGSFLCWNGEAWQIEDEIIRENDSKRVFELLLAAIAMNSRSEVLKAFSMIRGPFVCIFFDGIHQDLYYSRDCLGRRSLVQNTSSNGDFVLASISDHEMPDQWTEVEADGTYVISLSPSSTDRDSFVSEHFPLTFAVPWDPNTPSLNAPFAELNSILPFIDDAVLSLESPAVARLHDLLIASLTLRVQNIPGPTGTPLGVLFSGGLDSALLAYYCHLVLPPEIPIDLLNIAFQNPRIHKEDVEDPYSLCPDRITGLSAFAELQAQCSNRQYRFILINIPYEETMAHRDTIIRLMHPHRTEMDLSIASALYFASRAQGSITNEVDLSQNPYTSPTRVLLSGLGADELFAGYSRHAVAFSRRGYAGLIDEMKLDFLRLGKRNLGRDDRVTSHWSRELRYPFLDENLVKWAVESPVWHKCGFKSTNKHQDPDIEPGKLALRLLAWRAGLKTIALEKKRAIQFGSRTAKMHAKKTKGTDELEI